MPLEHDTDSPLAHAVRKAGSQTAFGELIGKRQSVIHDWLREQEYVPAEFVLLVEEKLGIPCWELNPDIYPPEKFQSPGTRPDDAPAADRLTAAGADQASTDRETQSPGAPGDTPAAERLSSAAGVDASKDTCS